MKLVPKPNAPEAAQVGAVDADATAADAAAVAADAGSPAALNIKIGKGRGRCVLLPFCLGQFGARRNSCIAELCSESANQRDSCIACTALPHVNSIRTRP